MLLPSLELWRCGVGLQRYIPWLLSAAVGLAQVVLGFQMMETLPPEKRKPFKLTRANPVRIRSATTLAHLTSFSLSLSRTMGIILFPFRSRSLTPVFASDCSSPTSCSW